jgi:hypothetical protein
LSYTFIAALLLGPCAQTSVAIFEPKESHPIKAYRVPRAKLCSVPHTLAVRDTFGTCAVTDVCVHSLGILRLLMCKKGGLSLCNIVDSKMWTCNLVF